jgi:hypothetical protein
MLWEGFNENTIRLRKWIYELPVIAPGDKDINKRYR